jgi:hypothetical protein
VCERKALQGPRSQASRRRALTLRIAACVGVSYLIKSNLADGLQPAEVSRGRRRCSKNPSSRWLATASIPARRRWSRQKNAPEIGASIRSTIPRIRIGRIQRVCMATR